MKKFETGAGAALILRTLGFLLGAAGIIMQFFADDVVGGGFMMNHDLAYFTVQTNLFSVAVFGILAWKTWSEYRKTGEIRISHISPGVHLACTCYITVTMLGFWTLLAPASGIPKNPFLFVSSLIMHTLTPLLAIGDYLLFAVHGKVPHRQVFRWLSYPAAYLVFVLIYSRLIREPYYSFPMGGEMVKLMYPYPFLDPQIMGIWGAAAAVAVLVVLFLLLGSLYIGIDRHMGRKQ